MATSIERNTEISKEISELSSLFDRVSYVSSKKARLITDQLDSLLEKIDDTLTSCDIFSKAFLEEQKEKAVSLCGRCATLDIDSQVVELAEKAEILSQLPEEKIKKECSTLTAAISKLKKNYALSNENRKLLRFAEILIEKARSRNSNEPLNFGTLLETIDHELAFFLLDLAQKFYSHQFKEALLLAKGLPQEIFDEFQDLLKTYKIDLTDFSDLKKGSMIARIIVGLSDKLTLRDSKFHLPELNEVDELFQS